MFLAIIFLIERKGEHAFFPFLPSCARASSQFLSLALKNRHLLNRLRLTSQSKASTVLPLIIVNECMEY